MSRMQYIALSAIAVGSIVVTTASAEEIKLRAISAFADGTTGSEHFEKFIERVNESGKGVLQIEYIGGGGKVMNPFEVGNAVKTGVVEIANVAGAFYTTILPEADALKLSSRTASEERRNGTWEYMNDLYTRKMNVYYLARQKDCVPFHLYLSKTAEPISEPDLRGYKIRATPTYRAFFTSMGAELIHTAPGDVYTALESGTVDGFGWLTQGLFELGWEEVTGYRVDPPFYRVDIEVLVNFDTWNAMSEKQRGFLQEQALWMESRCAEDEAENQFEMKRQEEAGIKTIEFTGEAAEQYVKDAYEQGWSEIVSRNPETGPKLKELLTR